MRLEPRDRRILVEAFSSRFVRRNDLIAFGLFHSVPRCNARLLRLKRALLLRPHFHLGGNELRAPFYSCTAKGARIAACELHIAPNEAISIHRARARDQAIQHALRCNDLRARLVADLNADELRLISWAPEILCRHQFRAPSGHEITIKPDALAVVSSGIGNHYLFIEVDLGNVALTRFLYKAESYDSYSWTRAFQDVYPADDFHVLTVTTDEQRLVNLQRMCSSSRFLFTTWKRLARTKLTAAIMASKTANQISLPYLLKDGGMSR